MRVTTYLDFKVGDIIVAKEKIWRKDTQSFIKEGEKITLSSQDDIILLPQPSKWKKYDANSERKW